MWQIFTVLKVQNIPRQYLGKPRQARAEILREKHVLSQVPLQEQEWIINTVTFHNAFEVPSFDDHKKTLFLRLIRDADNWTSGGFRRILSKP